MKPDYPKKIFYFLLAMIVMLLFLNVGSYYYVQINNIPEETHFFQAFNFDNEKNFPSIFSASLHFISSTILAIIGFSNLKIRKRKIFWFSLSVLFLFLGLDELLRIHEMVGSFLSSKIETSGIFYYSWVIPYSIALIIIAWISLKSLFELPTKISLSFLTAGIIFIFGALGLEMFTGWYISYFEIETENLFRMPEIFFLYTLEEFSEMIGVSYFIYSLLKLKKEFSD